MLMWIGLSHIIGYVGVVCTVALEINGDVIYEKVADMRFNWSELVIQLESRS